MNIKINDKEYELNFGIGFLREIDNLAGIKAGDTGINVGMGMMKTIPGIKAGDPLALLNVLYCGTHADNPRPSMQDIENYFGTLTDKQVEKMFNDTVKELKKSPLVRYQLNKIQ